MNTERLKRRPGDAPCPGIGAVPPADLPLKESWSLTEDSRRLIGFFLRPQIEDKDCPLSQWLTRRAMFYYDAFRWPVGLCVLAASRDMACWQLGIGEREVLAALTAAWEFAQICHCRTN